ncbi:CaiB/BaiF CoA transferase family protein [Pseudonocardia kunmingensis]|uniref:Crotonobetainyl-CoA:carnitine CoA-transferase CaiB-like acyl-CoA transferase n=1 Tax=Pseudonocardia kunmingensis TaxID=630975 RepID=A0A543DPR2_9PSEU|nr:CaiB/BaiF CoA-transferase family protein [Pseudonocardia kunmingensis]TQM11293.1 crotonobetainyl-CoA:carnitine CoA-transferase CaiB-like acyl-CoA transferase [Pseudonocardia kunmingensis]
MTAGLLAGVTVLDMTNVLAGPFAGYQLALLGADVVKVEVPGTGDLARQLGADPELSRENLGVSFLAQNAGKRSITVNLKNDAGREVFARLVDRADVLLENFRPGVLDRLGFGRDRLRELNPGLVYCAVSGFGATGPLSQRPAYDQVIQGMSGIMSVTGTPQTAPLRVGYPVCDSFGGLAAAFAISAALVRRQRTGEGAYLDVSMLDAALTSMGWVVSDQLVAGREPAPMGNENVTSAPSGTFETADGALNIAANKQEQFETLCRVLDRTELIDDPRFLTRDDRKAHREILRAELETSLKERTALEWDEILLPTGVPAAPVVSVPEALRSEQVAHRGLVIELPSPREDGGPLRVVGLPTQVDGAPVRPTAAPPRLGEHTDALLAELGYGPADIAELRSGGAV